MLYHFDLMRCYVVITKAKATIGFCFVLFLLFLLQNEEEKTNDFKGKMYEKHVQDVSAVATM